MPLAHSVSDVSKALGIGRTKTWELVNDGTIPTFRVDRRVLVADEDLEALIERLRTRSSRPIDFLIDLVDDEGRLDVARIPAGTTLADLEAVKRLVAERQAVA